LDTRLYAASHQGAAFFIEAVGPSLFCVRSAGQELTGLPVEDVVEGIAIRETHEFAIDAVDCGVKEHRNLVGVPVMHIVRRELEMPCDFAVCWVERREGAGVEVIARTLVAVPVRRRITDAQI